MGSLGVQELVLILVIVLVVFGGSRLPSLARSLAQTRNEFRKGLARNDDDSDDHDGSDSAGSSKA